MLINKNDSLTEVIRNVKHELNRGALDSKHPFRFVCLGTLGSEGPSMRYVVLREVTRQLELLIYTDKRSGKVTELAQNNSVSLLFYHPSKRVQLRVSGKAHLHQGDELASRHWDHVQGESLKAYGPVVPPGTPISDPADAYNWPEHIDATNFTLIRIVPNHIDVLQLNGFEHLRVGMERSGPDWEAHWLAP